MILENPHFRVEDSQSHSAAHKGATCSMRLEESHSPVLETPTLAMTKSRSRVLKGAALC